MFDITIIRNYIWFHIFVSGVFALVLSKEADLLSEAPNREERYVGGGNAGIDEVKIGSEFGHNNILGAFVRFGGEERSQGKHIRIVNHDCWSLHRLLNKKHIHIHKSWVRVCKTCQGQDSNGDMDFAIALQVCIFLKSSQHHWIDKTGGRGWFVFEKLLWNIVRLVFVFSGSAECAQNDRW